MNHTSSFHPPPEFRLITVRTFTEASEFEKALTGYPFSPGSYSDPRQHCGGCIRPAVRTVFTDPLNVLLCLFYPPRVESDMSRILRAPINAMPMSMAK